MRKTLLGTGLACAALLVGTVPAVAAPAGTTYHGTWTSADDCTTTNVQLKGIWNVTLLPSGEANVHITLFKSGQTGVHAVWGGSWWRFDPAGISGAATFDLNRDYAGMVQRFVLNGDQLVYTITNFPCEPTAKTVTMRGELRD